MTMVAIQENKKFPIIVGDLLTSSSENDKKLELPLFDKYYQIESKGKLYPFKLTSKIYVINNHMAVTIAGDYNKNKKFVEDISNVFKNIEPCKDELKRFEENYLIDLDEEKEAYSIVWYDNNSQQVVFQYYGKCWISKEFEKLGKINAVGSGADGYFEKINRFGENNLFSVDSINNAILNQLLINTLLMGEERFSLATLENSWGAGFEVICFDEEEKVFFKLDSIIYALWLGSYDNNRCLKDLKPISAVEYKYEKEFLTICCPIKTIPEKKIIVPIDMKSDSIDLSKFESQWSKSFHSKNIFNNFLIYSELKNKYYYVGLFSTDNDIILGFSSDNKFYFALSKKVETYIENKLEEIE